MSICVYERYKTKGRERGCQLVVKWVSTLVRVSKMGGGSALRTLSRANWVRDRANGGMVRTLKTDERCKRWYRRKSSVNEGGG